MAPKTFPVGSVTSLSNYFPPFHLQCYYIGAADISATKLVKEVTKPLSFGKPTEKICEGLKKKDEQICELRYGELNNSPYMYAQHVHPLNRGRGVYYNKH